MCVSTRQKPYIPTESPSESISTICLLYYAVFVRMCVCERERETETEIDGESVYANKHRVLSLTAW